MSPMASALLARRDARRRARRRRTALRRAVARCRSARRSTASRSGRGRRADGLAAMVAALRARRHAPRAARRVRGRSSPFARRDDAGVRSRRRADRRRRRRPGCRPSARSATASASCSARGVLRDGWEASLARTYVVGSPSVEQPPPAGWDELVAACAPGTTRRRAPRPAAPSSTASGAASSPGPTTSSLVRRPHGRARAPRRPQPPPGHRPHHRPTPQLDHRPDHRRFGSEETWRHAPDSLPTVGRSSAVHGSLDLAAAALDDLHAAGLDLAGSKPAPSHRGSRGPRSSSPRRRSCAVTSL